MKELWILVYRLGLLAVFSPVAISGATAVNPSDLEAPPRYLNPNLPGILCLMCSPGTYLQTHCTQNLTNSECRKCEVGKFSINYNRAESCENCRTPEKGCPIRNAHLVISCNSTMNSFCVCNPGYYYHSKSQNPMSEYEGDCQLHSSCPFGEGVKVRGTADNDTRCEPCPDGSFSDVRSATAPCRNYTKCSAGTEPDGGTKTSDVSCEPAGSEDDDSRVAAIVVPIVLCIFVAIVSAVIGFICYRRKKKRPEDPEKGNSLDDIPPTVTQNGSNGGGYTPVSPEPPTEPPSEPPTEPPPEPPSEPPTEPPSEPPSEPPVPQPSNGVEYTREAKPRLKVPWVEVNRFLSAKLSGTQDYRMALRSIMSKSGLDGDPLINEHTSNNPRDVKEMIYQVLCDWTKKSRPTLDNLISGLEDQKMNSIVSELKQHKSVKPFLDNEQAT